MKKMTAVLSQIIVSRLARTILYKSQIKLFLKIQPFRVIFNIISQTQNLINFSRISWITIFLINHSFSIPTNNILKNNKYKTVLIPSLSKRVFRTVRNSPPKDSKMYQKLSTNMVNLLNFLLKIFLLKRF
jgi:hypothetical protein